MEHGAGRGHQGQAERQPIVFHLAQPHEVDSVWPHIADGFNEAMEKTGGDISSGYLWQQCRTGQAFLVVAAKDGQIVGASVWRPETWASGEKLRCLGLHGENATEWFAELIEEMRAFAKRCGAEQVVFEGREGWAASKLLRNEKPRKLRTLYEIEV